MIGRIIAALALAFALTFAATAARAAERVLSLLSDVKVERNGDLLVTETIQVQAEGVEIRRGILRDFPTRYTRRDGTRVEVGFDVQSVTRDGADETFATERLANGVRLRIGRADRFLTPARIPTSSPIAPPARSASSRISTSSTGTLSAPAGYSRSIGPKRASGCREPVLFTQMAVYTGAQGAQGKDAAVVWHEPGFIVFRTTRPLGAHEGLTVAVAWRKGVVDQPTQVQLLQSWIEDNAPSRGGGRRHSHHAALLRAGVVHGGTRSAAWHDHSVVRGARGHVGSGRALRARHEF